MFSHAWGETRTWKQRKFPLENDGFDYLGAIEIVTRVAGG